MVLGIVSVYCALYIATLAGLVFFLFFTFGRSPPHPHTTPLRRLWSPPRARVRAASLVTISLSHTHTQSLSLNHTHTHTVTHTQTVTHTISLARSLTHTYIRRSLARSLAHFPSSPARRPPDTYPPTSYTLNPKPSTLNRQPSSLNPEP